MFPTTVISNNHRQANKNGSGRLTKKINDMKDVIHFKTSSPAYKNILTLVDLLCERIQGTGNKTFNHKYSVKDGIFERCICFLSELEKCCDETDLNSVKGAGTRRFGHVAYRDWFDAMETRCRQFINEQLVIGSNEDDEQYKEELFIYLSESFGNKMRIDYGTGHELNFIIFIMGLCNLVGMDPLTTTDRGDVSNLPNLHQKQPSQAEVVTQTKLQAFVETHGWDILYLYAQKYLKLCRRIQTKFRLEPAGSRGVYNMDDYQFLPFLFGAAQLCGTKYISTSDFYQPDQVDQYKDDYIFFEAVDFILNNKRGPFNEHSYTLWGFTNLGSWDNIFRRIRLKFIDDVLGPFPIVQHFLFGNYILMWNPEQEANH